jgi:tRNA(fMet)-specific endonuclease VapC
VISYMLDTNHASALLKHNPNFLNRLSMLASSIELSISVPSVAELWYMVFNSQKVAANRADLEGFLSRFPRIEFGELAAIEFGKIKTELRKIGRPIPDADIQIAVATRVNDLTLLTADPHFNHLAGIRTENWLQ